MIATDPLSLVFIFCFLLGFGFFLITALLGGHAHGSGHSAGHMHLPSVHHAPHVAGHAHVASHAHGGGRVAGQSHATSQQHGGQQQTQGQQHTNFSLFAYINPTTIGLFLLGFGLFGYFFHNLTNLAASLSLFFAIVSGVVLAVALFLGLNRLFASAEGSTEQDVVDRTGMIGKVSITIPEKGIGEIIYISPGGMRKSIPARGLDSHRLERDQEVVVVNYQNGVAEVDTWEHFIQEDLRASDPSTFDELQQLRSLLNNANPAEMEIVIQQDQQKG